jgi:hypothetical protein
MERPLPFLVRYFLPPICHIIFLHHRLQQVDKLISAVAIDLAPGLNYSLHARAIPSIFSGNTPPHDAN